MDSYKKDVSSSNSPPYDFVGKLHNEAMDYLVGTATYAQENEVIIDINTILWSFLAQNRVEISKDDFLLNLQTTWEEFSASLPEIDELLKNEEISAQEHNHLSYIIAVIDSLDDDLSRVPEIIEAIKEAELKIISDQELSQNSMALLLSTTSVARRSTEYWSKEVQDNLRGWFDNSTDIVIVANKKDAKDTIKKDVKGAVKGGGTKLILGPTAIAIGAGIGAIKGSAGKAIVKGAKKLWQWIRD